MSLLKKYHTKGINNDHNSKNSQNICLIWNHIVWKRVHKQKSLLKETVCKSTRQLAGNRCVWKYRTIGRKQKKSLLKETVSKSTGQLAGNRKKVPFESDCEQKYRTTGRKQKKVPFESDCEQKYRTTGRKQKKSPFWKRLWAKVQDNWQETERWCAKVRDNWQETEKSLLKETVNKSKDNWQAVCKSTG